jgi:hypothetical protein
LNRRVLAAAACVAMFAGCNPQAPKSAKTPAPAHPHPATAPPLHITGQGTQHRPVRLIQQIQNRVEYELVTNSYESTGTQGRELAVARDATITFHDRKGITLTARAPQAILDEKANTITLLNDVHGRTSSGITLTCDRLVYDRKAQLFHGYGNVVIVNANGFRGTGSKFDSDVALSHIRMQ